MYPSDANGTIPGAGEGARCTAASIAARKLTFVTDLWLAEGSYEGPAVGLNATMGGSGFEEALFTERAVGLIDGIIQEDAFKAMLAPCLHNACRQGKSASRHELVEAGSCI